MTKTIQKIDQRNLSLVTVTVISALAVSMIAIGTGTVMWIIWIEIRITTTILTGISRIENGFKTMKEIVLLSMRRKEILIRNGSIIVIMTEIVIISVLTTNIAGERKDLMKTVMIIMKV